MHRLEMPDALSGARVERQQAIAEQIVSNPIVMSCWSCTRCGSIGGIAARAAIQG
jgi:hypothetical protein